MTFTFNDNNDRYEEKSIMLKTSERFLIESLNILQCIDFKKLKKILLTQTKEHNLSCGENLIFEIENNELLLYLEQDFNDSIIDGNISKDVLKHMVIKIISLYGKNIVLKDIGFYKSSGNAVKGNTFGELEEGSIGYTFIIK